MLMAENFETSSSKNKEASYRPLYPERPSSGIDEKVRQIADFEAGRAEKIPLLQEEREEISSLENALGATLEKIFEITPREATFYAEYFLNEEGRRDFETVVGQPLGAMGNSVQDIEKRLYSAAPLLAKLDAKRRSDFAGRSRDWSEQQLFDRLSATIDTDSRIRVDGIDSPTAVKLLLSPDKNLDKILALRNFKDQIKRYEETADIALSEKSEAFRAALAGVLRLYQARVNFMIAESASSAFVLNKKLASVDEENLSEDEKILLAQAVGLENTEKNLARYDKFIHGADANYDAGKQRRQVGDDMESFAREFEAEYIASLSSRNEQIAERGLDHEKVFSESIPVQEVESLAEETLAAYGLLSEHPPEEYSPDRVGPAPDNKWQFIASQASKTMSVDSKRKIVLCGIKNQSAASLISVTLAHEIEGHVLQHENKSKIPLRLFQKLGSGRTDIFAECGAMNNQDIVSREAFGYASPTHPHYIRAMLTKLDGGNYLDCTNAFYESAMKGPRMQKTLGKISEEDFRKYSQKNLRLAINRAKRLFRDGSDFASREPFLTKSKDTVYLEQVRLFQELKKYELEKYAFVIGANLDALIFLMKSGFLDPQNIEKPKYHSLQVWERMKGQYLKEKL